MKKVALFLTAILMFGSLAKAQSNKEEIDLMQAAFGMDKKSFIEGFVEVMPAQKDAFWKLYDEYETSRKDLGKKRIELYLKYDKTFDKMTTADADAFMKSVMDLSVKTDALISSYYEKIKKVTNSMTAMQFYVAEQYILTTIRNRILGEMPFAEKKK
jgi:hypothetical protein